ncbi:helix-turn-helix transcriptional regulator [Fulvivirgaceae bacterium BMA10]|uniref:Helix-turn-helix transcriptional regulator n=1 Tax=Splendidivirga corallicola TaxID=3051826 RepID=A0ABT8KHM7_9BACT|nr:helix-turn-helix transcriptional regulator [Fulvivirgaceae bacterium BMA10]
MMDIKKNVDLTIHYNAFPEAGNTNGLFRSNFDNTYAIVWLKEGRGRYSIDFKEYEFKPNTIILISKDQNTTFEFFDENSQYVVITFSQDLVSASDDDIRQLLSFCIREHFEGKQILSLNAYDTEYLEMIMNQLFKIYSTWNDQFKHPSIFHLLQLFLVYCNKLKTQQEQATSGDYIGVVADFTSLLEQNFKKTHKVSDYTDNLNLTYNSLSRYTTNYCSKTPKEIIVERVILEAKRLLSGTKLPIKKIAYQLGFDEPTNLVKYFKKNTGTTPTEFRTKN